MSLGPYTIFIVTSYVLAAFVVTALTVWVIADFRRQSATLRHLEQSGVTRRSSVKNTAHKL